MHILYTVPYKHSMEHGSAGESGPGPMSLVQQHSRQDVNLQEYHIRINQLELGRFLEIFLYHHRYYGTMRYYIAYITRDGCDC
jgi:hypothetical protein